MTRILAAALAAFLAPMGAFAQAKEPLKIGIPQSAFRDVPPALLTFAGDTFRDLMKSQTGLEGEVTMDADALSIAKAIDSGKLQLGVFLGHEFACAKDKYPDLVPLVCSVPRPREIQAYLLVRWDSKAAHLGDLKGAKLALATGTRDYARLFLERRKAAEMGDGGFSTTVKAANVHEAIQQVIEGEADVTVADHAAWNYFQKLYPGASQNIRILSRSEVFPPTVIVCKKGAIPDETVKHIREGLLNAHNGSRASKVMNLIKVEKFEEIPAGYDDALKACLKAYPTPLGDK
ncbi:MAG: PhnD/SsuA/transferrin family substrate-binding protein [Zavarzinella sp.]|nr:PhnD/SsuA/transferrin family substrate-binding protein [Zavarzinella sp.]